MKLADMMPAEAKIPVGAGDLDVVGMTSDSRHVEPGMLFAALAGYQFDGTRFVQAAVNSGAIAVLAAGDAALDDCAVPIVRADDPRRALALAAANFYGRQPDIAVAVTGTSGKTSVAEFTRQIFAGLGCQAASMGTIGIVKPDGGVYGSLTTPDPVTLHGVIAGLADDGVTHLAFEASSHGLDQRRLDGVRLCAGAFTNLGRDHLDYHPTVEHYLAAKLRLFDTLLPEGAAAVVNIDDKHSDAVMAACQAQKLEILTVGQQALARLQLLSAVPDGFAQDIEFAFNGRAHQCKLNLMGTYQASNALVAAGLALSLGNEPDAVFEQLEQLRGVTGRLEVVGEVHGATIVIDYAHKPDALDAALTALRPFVTNRLVSVFGCGGDRDPGKRPIMGQISQEKADLTIITDDNPRTEAPEAIRAEILLTAKDATEIGDRYMAIATAISQAQPGDVILIAGKGHETGQIVGDEVLSFSDYEAVAAILREY